ncbi:MAG: DUF2007 domain-containing protein [Bryobacteraceae bacterium]|jgi:hypothetical protein|nr:DUF2007 domain-containing protein [Bryobacteraceae bacterium]
MDPADLVVIATYSTWMQAQFAQSMLESAGIESSLSNEFRLASGWHLTSSHADGMQLSVRAADAADALAILREVADSKE